MSQKIDDTFTHKTQESLLELNNIHPNIEFTVELEKEGELALLNPIWYRGINDTIQTKVSKKTDPHWSVYKFSFQSSTGSCNVQYTCQMNCNYMFIRSWVREWNKVYQEDNGTKWTPHQGWLIKRWLKLYNK